MTKTEAYKRLLILATEQLQESAHNYHNLIPQAFLLLLQEAQEAKPKRLAAIVAEAEATLRQKGFPPGLR
jgi:hypothetical protein